MKKTKLTLGKKIGLVAFIVSELLVIFIAAIIFIVYIKTRVVLDLIPTLCTFQGSVFVTIFAGVSTKNFKKISEAVQNDTD